MIPLPKTCLGCPLFSEHKGFSILEGDGSSGLLVVAESLGRQEEKAGLPLRPTAPAGGVFQRAVNVSGLKRSLMTLTNTIRCKSEAQHPPEAIVHCRQYLDQAVEERKPRMILALGDVPLRELSTVGGSISELRGYVLQSRYGIPMIATYHPSHLAREPAKFSQLFGVFMHDLRVAERMARRGVPEKLSTRYNLTPTVEDCERLLERLQADPALLLSIDVETASILGQTEPESWKHKRIIQIQFSCVAGEALAIPFADPFLDVIRRILLTNNPKVGWNSRLSDEIVLRAHGFEIGGEFYDGMLMWSHLQPSFGGGRDASDDEDKGAPAKLLNLQSAVSFYYPQEGVWKHTVVPAGLGYGGYLTLLHRLRWYGCRDADLAWRVGTRLMQTLKSQGLWHGFYRYKHLLGQVLTKMSERGLPIDRERQQNLHRKIEEQLAVLDDELQSQVPLEVKPVKTYKSWPVDLREAVKAAGLWVKCCKPQEFPEVVAAMGYEINGCLLKRLPFNPDSPKQVMRYIEYQVEAVGRPWFVPIDVDTRKPTTNKAGIESLISLTDDPTLKQIRKCKKIADLRSYCEGEWVPGDDDRVHTEFRVGATATGQTSAVRPPVQTYPKHVDPEDTWLVPFIKDIKSIIRAKPRHRMVEVDMTGFHAKVQGHLAGDLLYSRLASLDLHSYNTAYYLKLPDAPSLSKLDDESLSKRLKQIRDEHSYERNFILKRIAYLRQFRGGEQKAASILKIPVVEVMEIFDMMDAEFKPTFKDFPAAIEKLLNKSPKLVSPFGCQRWFWDQDIQQAVAFLPANCAHCTIQDALIRLDKRGALDKYQAVNFVHDALWFHCPDELVDECIAVVKEELERPSEILVSEKMGAFQCGASVSVGLDMAMSVEDT